MRRDGSTYYPVLEHEIILRNITKKEMREFLDIEQSCFVLKLNGARMFSLEEAIRLQEEFFPDVTVNELFRHDGGGVAAEKVPACGTSSRVKSVFSMWQANRCHSESSLQRHMGQIIR